MLGCLAVAIEKFLLRVFMMAILGAVGHVEVFLVLG
jgi:hypothetical protein